MQLKCLLLLAFVPLITLAADAKAKAPAPAPAPVALQSKSTSDADSLDIEAPASAPAAAAKSDASAAADKAKPAQQKQKSAEKAAAGSAAEAAAADQDEVKRNNNYQTQPQYGQQPAYVSNVVYEKPSYSKPTYVKPSYSKPVYTAPVYNEKPTATAYNHQPSYSKPVYNEKPVYGAQPAPYQQVHHTSYNNVPQQYGHHQQPYGNDYDTLLQTNVIFRLGDRTPFWLPRNDYYKEKDFPEGLNQLINVGKERLVNYGRVLRERYQSLINNLRLKDISTQSAADRVTVDSALALLAGLLPPTGDQVWSTSNYNADELARLWQPVAVSTVEARRDWKLSHQAPCRTAELVENVTITEVPELRHFLTANREVIRRLEVLTGEDFTGDLSWIWIANLYDTYISEAEYFGPAFYPPRWADEQTLAVLKQANELKFSVWGHDQAYLRLRGGPLLQEITDNLIRAAKDEAGGRSLAIYSTFDTNIAIIEHSLGIFRGGQAGYGSGLLIELHRDNSNYNNKGNEPVVAVFSVDVPSGVKISQVDLSRSERFRKHCYSTGPSCPLSSFAVALQHHLLSLAEAEVKCNND